MHGLKNIMFVDVRGFTAWCNRVGLANVAGTPLLQHLYQIISSSDFEYWKFLGDGAMVFAPAQISENGSKDDLRKLLKITAALTEEFDQKKIEVSNGYGFDCKSLKLGFGFAKGLVAAIEISGLRLTEYIGDRVNLAARLCSVARPSGIVIDRESFSTLPDELQDKYAAREIKKISGFSERRVWVSEDVIIDDKYESFESLEKLAEVHVTGLCTHQGKLLLAKRGPNRDIYANVWAGPGGKVKKSESFEAALKRQFREEVGIEIDNIQLQKTYFIDTHRIPGLMFRCILDSGKAEKKSEENQEIRWVSLEELESLELVPGLRSVAQGVLKKTR